MTSESTEVAPDLLDEVLAHPDLLSLVYQPIVDLERAELVGYEALARFPGSQDTRLWFEVAEARGQGVELEMMVLGQVVERVTAVPQGRFLSVNLSLEAVADPRTKDLVARAGEDAGRLMIELTDPLPLGDVSDLVAAVEPLRALGALVAVHVGPWQQALTSMTQLRPDIVKVRSGLEGGSTGVGRDELSNAIARYGEELGADVVVTAVEGRDDLWTVTGSRAAMAQGYVLGRPDVVMTELSPGVSALVLGKEPEHQKTPPPLGVRRRPAAPATVALDGRDQPAAPEPGSLTRVLRGLHDR